MRERARGLTQLGAVVAAMGCALALAASAAAKTTEYKGPIGPSGAISFSVKGKGDRAKVIDLEWFRLPIECGKNNTEDTSSGTLSYKLPVDEKGKFNANAVLGPKKDPKAQAIIKGKINGERAHGSIIVRGFQVPVTDAGTGDCDSGKHPWNAAG